MTYLKLERFSGVSPRTAPTQLAPEQAQIANNVCQTSLGLSSWMAPKAVYTPSSPTTLQTIYKLVNQTTDAFRWLGWTSQVDVVPGPVGDTTESRIYYTGDGGPKKTNWSLATSSGTGVDPFPNGWLYMGVPAPTAAPAITPSGGSAPTETRAYVYTNVSTFGAIKEESAPSPATLVTCNSSGATVTVTGFSAAPGAGYNVTHRRIYRTVTGASSVVYSFVAEIPVATTSYSDTLTVAQLGSALQTTYYLEPPTGLTGIVAMPNGVLAGFTGNQVWFCEPYLPHAWPYRYMMTVNDVIVGLAVYANNLVVLTQRNPVVITGTTPGAMSQQKLPMMQPCVSRRSIATDQYGVLYASPNGIVSIGNGSSDVVTTPLYTRKEWQKITPSTMFSIVYNNMYIGFCAAVTGEVNAVVLSRGDVPPLFNMDFQANAVYVEPGTGAVFCVSRIDNNIYQLDADPLNFTFYEWLSKEFIMASPTSFAAMKVEGDYSMIANYAAWAARVASITAANQVLFAAQAPVLNGGVNGTTLNSGSVNGSILTDIPQELGSRSINIFVYGDGVLLHTQGVYNDEPFRLPAGVKCYRYEIRITGNAMVSGVLMATSMTELKQVANG